MVAIVVSALVIVADLRASGGEPATAAPPESAPTAAPDGEPAPPTTLADVLPSAERTDGLVGTYGLAPSSTLTQLATVTTSHPQCGGIFTPGTASAYADSPKTAVVIQSYRLPSYEHADAVVQAVVQFRDAAAADAFVEGEQRRWTACERIWITEQPQLPGFFTGVVTVRDGVVLAGTTAGRDNFEWLCQRGLTAADDVVIDVKVCNFGGSDKADVLANYIADRVEAR